MDAEVSVSDEYDGEAGQPMVPGGERSGGAAVEDAE